MATRNRRSLEEKLAKLCLSTKAGIDFADQLLGAQLDAAWKAMDKDRVYQLHELREGIEALIARGWE